MVTTFSLGRLIGRQYDPSVRIEAAILLEKCSFTSKFILQDCIILLKSDTHSEKLAALRLLATIGPDAKLALEEIDKLRDSHSLTLQIAAKNAAKAIRDTK